MATKVAVAVTVHDPNGSYVPGLERLAGTLRSIFADVAAAVTRPTSSATKSCLSDDIGATIVESDADGRVGLHRRESVRLAIAGRPSQVIYSDLDHMLRWVENNPDELAACLVSPCEGMQVIGRTAAAMAGCPRRLRETERLVNSTYELMTGNAFDLMFAVRRMSLEAATKVVELSTEDSLANDVDWPLLIESVGLPVTYFEAEGLSYRTTDEFDGPADESRDRDAGAWIRRLEFVGQHASAMRKYLR